MPKTFYQTCIFPLLNTIDPEKSHDWAVSLLNTLEHLPGGLALLARLSGNTANLRQDDRLKISFHGLNFNSPIMVAAGWDKHGLCSAGLHALGFSSIEVGGVTLEPQAGHTKPRIFRIAPGVLINHCGFNSVGAQAANCNLERYAQRDFPLGINLGKNAQVPAENSAEHFGKVAALFKQSVDYYVVNISSPNTTGLRDLQQRNALVDIIQAISRDSKPLFIKISPDLTLHALDEIIDVALQQGLSGIVAVNTFLDPQAKAQYQAESIKGGLSGNNTLYRDRATQFCRHIYQETQGKLTVIASGGVYNTYTLLEKITAGASMVQLMTAIASEGPGIANTMKKELIAFMERHQIAHISDCIGQEEYLKLYQKALT